MTAEELIEEILPRCSGIYTANIRLATVSEPWLFSLVATAKDQGRQAGQEEIAQLTLDRDFWKEHSNKAAERIRSLKKQLADVREEIEVLKSIVESVSNCL